MPIYDYRCSGCGHEFEFLLMPAFAAKPACPSCRSEHLERLPSGFAVSTAELRASRVKETRAAQQNSANYKEHQRAEAEHIREHINEQH